MALSTHASDWSYRTAHDYVMPAEDNVVLTPHSHLIRPLWSYEIHTGIGSSSSGPAGTILSQGFEPTYGETAAAVVIDGVYILSWSEATGDVIARPESMTDRYWRGQATYNRFKDTYLRIDANWNTIALDGDTGKKLWKVSQPSASINFQSSKRTHNGIDPVAGNGIYVTLTVTGRVFAYDIATGKKRWETNVGEWHESAEAFKAEALANRNLPTVSAGMFGSLRPGAAMVGDSVIVPNLRGGLIALRSKDGSELWRIDQPVLDRQGTPRLWEHNRKTYLLTHQNRGNRAVYLIDPADGSIVWTHQTGNNPGKLIIGQDTVILNPENEDPGLLAAYRISLQGLERLWRFPDVQVDRVQPNHVHLSGSRGAERKGVVADGRLYIALGQPNKRPEGRRLAVFDLATGKELYRSDYTITSSVAAPVSYGDKLYWQITSTSAQNAGLYIYQKHEDGRLELLGEARYRPLGVMLTTDYEHPTDHPFSKGLTFLRGRTNILALDLREPAYPPVNMLMENAWAGFVRPVSGVLVANQDRLVEIASIEVPPRAELGVPGTTARRNDVWSRMEFSEPLKVGEAWDTTATMHMAIFSWPARIVMEEAKGNQWHGQWTRSFAGWDETLTFEGHLHESSEGGYSSRGWPTPWYEDRPVSFFSDLEEGQERVVLQMHRALPRQDGSRRNVTICLDHDGKKVVSAAVGGFQFNQSYHELDASNLKVSSEGIKGTAMVILNGDPWAENPDWKNGGSLLGRLTIDVHFGERGNDGIYPVTGKWSLEWGVSAKLTGSIRATLER
ncbi:MAG: PQQ-binding-like beta-propeller repeat protein [Phycisphaeraceae bacterium]|nr:PQQ-binding-like beta-propeller repeat protein [Phycisphaeraceae bacterium]